MTRNKSLLFFLFIFFVSVSFAEISPDESKLAYDAASKKIDELQSGGYPTLPLLDMLNDAQVRFNYANYNISRDISVNLVVEAEKIVKLSEDILDLSGQINALSTFGVDTISLEMELLYVMADYEAANVDLALTGKNELASKVFVLARNHSSSFYDEIEIFDGYLYERNLSSELFNSYYVYQKKNYEQKKFDVFLKNYLDFSSIKSIVLLEIEFNKNIMFLELNNIFFEGSKDLILIFNEELSLNNYEGALSTLTSGNDIALTAIEVFSELDNVESEYERLESLGIMNNETKALYESVLSEFELGNFLDSKILLDETRDAMVTLETNNIIFGGISRASLKKGFWDFFKRYWSLFLVFIAVSVLSFNFFKNGYALHSSKKNLKKFERDHSTTIELQKGLQRSYYFEKSIDKDEYKTDFEEYEEQKIVVSNNISSAKDKIKFCVDYFNDLKDKKDKFLSRFKKSHS